MVSCHRLNGHDGGCWSPNDFAFWSYIIAQIRTQCTQRTFCEQIQMNFRKYVPKINTEEKKPAKTDDDAIYVGRRK